MIKVICGGKPNKDWTLSAISEYEKRLTKPFNIEWEFYEEEKLAKLLETWPFTSRDFTILLDERGQLLSSPEFTAKLENCFNSSLNPIIIIGGAYGVSVEARARASLTLSLSPMVFPHLLARTILVEQLYRAQEIQKGSKYHHL